LDVRVKQLSLLLEEVGLPPGERKLINNLLEDSHDAQWFKENKKTEIKEWDQK